METQEFFKKWKSDSPNCWVEIFDNDKVEEIYQNEEKCKNCNNGCLGCDYFENNIIPKIKKLKDSLKGDL